MLSRTTPILVRCPRVAAVLALSALGLGHTTTAYADAATRWQVRGLDSGRVYQRGEDDKATLQITGQAPEGAREMTYRVMRRHQVVAGFDALPVALDADGAWSLSAELPTGGPYRFEFDLTADDGGEADRRTIDDVWVGDLWVLAGQSNMDGCGPMDSPWVQKPSEGVHYFSLAEQWSVAEDPMHFCNEATYPVYLTSYSPSSPTGRRPIDYRPRGTWPDWQKTDNNQGAGLGLPFGKRLYEETGVPVGLVLCSLGGTTMAHWSSDLKNQGGESLYGAMLLRLQAVGGRVAGVLWWQGESQYSSGGYHDEMARLIQSVRSDFQQADLPFYIVQLGPQDVGDPATPSMERNRIRDAQRMLAVETPGVEVVAAIDQKLSSSAHVDTEGYTRVGWRLANVALREKYGVEGIQTGPQLGRVRVDGSNPRRVHVIFDGVNGGLRADGGVKGFSIRPTGGGDESVTIVEATVQSAQRNVVVLTTDRPIPKGASLWYGYGWTPVANVVDEKDMALPAFGPVDLDN